MIDKEEVMVYTTDEQEVYWSYQSNLIMLHADFISAQWEPNKVGIEVMKQPENMKVAIHHIGVGHHQSFYFKQDNFEDLLCFFRLLGFPCRTPNPFGL